MYKCKPNTHLSVEVEAGDVAYLPRRLFERLFDDFEGGVLGVVLRANEETMHATAAPSAEPGDSIYVPLWMATAFEQRTLRDLEVLDFTVERAEPTARASLIVVRQCVEMEIDVRDALELFLYDCRYVHANTVLHVGGCEVWIERVIDSEGFEVAVAELGPEVSLDIQGSLDDGGRAEAEASRIAEAAEAEASRIAEAIEAAREAEKAVAEAARVAEESKKPIIPDAATIRAQRLKFFETQNKKDN